MREIKFRCWDVEGKCWVGGGAVMDLNFSGRYNAFFFDNDNFDIPKKVIWVQYTGLRDKHGVMIFEGDVVKHLNGVKPVEWYETLGAWTMHLSDFVPDQEEPYGSEIVEVVGNIYQNPEMVK